MVTSTTPMLAAPILQQHPFRQVGGPDAHVFAGLDIQRQEPFRHVTYRVCELRVFHSHAALGKHQRLAHREFPRRLGKHLADGQSVEPWRFLRCGHRSIRSCQPSPIRPNARDLADAYSLRLEIWRRTQRQSIQNAPHCVPYTNDEHVATSDSSTRAEPIDIAATRVSSEYHRTPDRAGRSWAHLCVGSR